MTEPAPTAEAAGYLVEMLSSMSHFAHISNLHNSAVMLAAASQIVQQECRLVTQGPPKPSDGTTIEWPFPVDPYNQSRDSEDG